jgi:hypothetical protein
MTHELGLLPEAHDKSPYWTVRSCTWDGMGWHVTFAAPEKVDLRSRLYSAADVEKAVKAERERCAKVCESEAEKMREQASLNPEDSPARDRFVSRWRALASIATEIKLGPSE